MRQRAQEMQRQARKKSLGGATGKQKMKAALREFISVSTQRSPR